MDNLENRIEEAKSKPPTAENLNYLGDLYFKSRNKHKAISCYYEAIDKLHYGQKEKQIAIYKKIIRNFPKDVDAYEGIAVLYRRMGLFSEEIEYLTIVAHIYQNQGNYNRALSAAKRICDLDPENKFALKLLKAEEDIFIEKKVRDAKLQQEMPADEPHGQTIASTLSGDTTAVGTHETKEPDAVDTGVVYTVKDRSDKGLFTATIEEVAEVKKPEFVFEPPKSNLRTYIFSGVLFFFIVAAAVLFLYRGKPDDILTVTKKDSGRHEKLWRNNSIKHATDKFEFTITRITEKMLAESGIPDSISQDTVLKTQFYSVSVKTISGCLPDAFISSPHGHISLVDSKGSLHELESLAGISSLNNFIYRANTCNKDFGAVFARIFVYHMKEASYNGISFKGLEGAVPLIVMWK